MLYRLRNCYFRYHPRKILVNYEIFIGKFCGLGELMILWYIREERKPRQGAPSLNSLFASGFYLFSFFSFSCS